MQKTIRKKWTHIISKINAFAFVLLFVGSLAYFYSTLLTHTLNNELQRLNQTASQVEYVQMQVENLSKQIIVDEDVADNITKASDTDAFSAVVGRDNMRQLLMSYVNLNDYYTSIQVLTDDGELYSSDRYITSDDILQTWYTNFADDNQKSGFTEIHGMRMGQYSKKWPVISYIMHYYLRESGAVKEGKIIINIRLDKIIQENGLNETLLNGYCIYDRKGSIVFEEGIIHKDYDKFRLLPDGVLKEQKQVFLKNSNFLDGWFMISEASYLKVLYSIRGIILIFVIVYAAVLVVLYQVMAGLITRLTGPIEQLHRAAVKVQKGDYSCHVNINTGDELEILGNTFNELVDSIHSNIEKAVVYEKEKKEMEVDRLLLQINPHFIYNTLNSIVYMAQIKGDSDIVEYTNAFISMLQETLQMKGAFLTVEEELQNTQHYLILLKYRYGSQFDVCVDVDEDLMDAMIPGIVLQPLIENAVFHGLAVQPQKGLLTISIKKHKLGLMIQIIDNGAGMSQKVLDEIRNNEEALKHGMRKIGIANVRKRLEALYEKPYGMYIDSKEGKGTTISVYLPYQRKDIFKEERVDED